MSLTFLSRPIKTINATTSPWIAANNPIVYQLQREDATFDQVNDSSGSIQIQFTAVDVASSYTTGDNVWVQSTNGVYALLCTVVTSAFTTDTLVTMGEAYISAAPGGFINNLSTRLNYKVLVKCYNNIDDTQIGADQYVSPFTDGLLNIDVSLNIRSELTPEMSFDFSGDDAQENTDAHISFYIGTTEQWTGSAETESTDDTNVVDALSAAMQIGDENGSNMYDYSVADNFKFLTKFDALPVFDGHQNILSVIRPATSNILFKNLGVNKQPITMSGTGLFDVSIDTDADSYQVYEGNENIILAPSSWSDLGGFCAVTNPPFGTKNATQFIKTGITTVSLSYVAYQAVTIPTGSTIVPFDIIVTVVDSFSGGGNSVGVQVATYKSDGDLCNKIQTDNPLNITEYLFSAAGTYTRPITLATPGGDTGDADFLVIFLFKNFTSGTADVTITIPAGDILTSYISTLSELKTLDIKESCPNPINLFWKNSLSGRSNWVFDFNQELSFTYQNGRKAKRYLLQASGLTATDWDAINELNTIGDIYGVKFIELTSDINKTLARTDQQVYMVDEDGNKIGVIVIPNEIRTFTKYRKHTIEIIIELPDIFI